MGFSKMYCKVKDITPETGELEGTCCICGEGTSEGFKKKFGSNFSTANIIYQTGTVLCPTCHQCVSLSNALRRTMFLVTEREYKEFKKQDIKDIIFNLPSEPFYLYLTKTWQKIGWIVLDNALNTGAGPDYKVVIDYDVITFNINNLKKYYELIVYLIDIGVSKTVLESGEVTPYHYKKLVEARGTDYARHITLKLKEFLNNPEWLLAVYVANPKKR